MARLPESQLGWFIENANDFPKTVQSRFRECRPFHASSGHTDFVVDHGSVSIAEAFTGKL